MYPKHLYKGKKISMHVQHWDGNLPQIAVYGIPEIQNAPVCEDLGQFLCSALICQSIVTSNITKLPCQEKVSAVDHSD